MQYVTRTAWKAREATSSTPFAHKLGVAIHWAGEALGITDHAAAEDHVRRIQADHMEGRNSDKQPWADIAYNFVVWNDYVFEGRGWDHRSAANGENDANANYLAICVLIGPGESFTEASMFSVAELTAIGRRNHGVGPDVWPHSHFRQTACPGDEIRN